MFPDRVPMARLIMLAQPRPEANMPCWKPLWTRISRLASVRPGLPYVEGLTIDEAMNELAFIGTGLYGKGLENKTGRRCALCCRGNMALRD